MHKEQARLLVEDMTVKSRDLDRPLPHDFEDRIDFGRGQDEIAGDGGFAAAGRKIDTPIGFALVAEGLIDGCRVEAYRFFCRCRRRALPRFRFLPRRTFSPPGSLRLSSIQVAHDRGLVSHGLEREPAAQSETWFERDPVELHLQVAAGKSHVINPTRHDRT
jgi:hypothetical protein